MGPNKNGMPVSDDEMTMGSQLELCLDIRDFDADPHDITALIGVDPWSISIKGELNAKGIAFRRNSWYLRSKVSSYDASLEEHWLSIKDILLSKKDVINAIAQKCAVKMTIVVHAGERFPSIIIPPSMSFFAGYIGAIIDIDVFE